MRPSTVLLLPGMDGTGDLFEPFVRAAPEHLQFAVVRLPPLMDYGELWDSVIAYVPEREFVVIAESFSGPLAIELAAAYPARVTALVLYSSFSAAPRAAALQMLPWSLIFALPLLSFVIRWFLVGPDASPELVRTVRRAIRTSSPSLLAARLRSVLSLPPRIDRGDISCPVLILRGTDDRLLPAEVSKELLQTLRTGTLSVIPGPHLLLQAVPESAWGPIIKFLEVV